MKINYDYWWLRRRDWLDSLQAKPNDDWKDPMLWSVLGILLTAILILEWGT